MNERDQAGEMRCLDAVASRDLDDEADLRIDLRPAFPHREIAPDAGMGLCGLPIEVGERRQTRFGGDPLALPRPQAVKPPG